MIFDEVVVKAHIMSHENVPLQKIIKLFSQFFKRGGIFYHGISNACKLCDKGRNSTAGVYMAMKGRYYLLPIMKAGTNFYDLVFSGVASRGFYVNNAKQLKCVKKSGFTTTQLESRLG